MLDELARLKAMLRRRGTALPNVPDADALAALERCKSCNYQGPCAEFLAAPDSGGVFALCANSHYVAVRRQRHLEFTGAWGTRRRPS